MSYIRYVLFVVTSSCLQEGSCLIYVMFCQSLPLVVCRKAHVLFTLCSVRLYHQLFVEGLMSYIRYGLFVFTSSCLQEGSCLIYVMFCSSLPPVVCERAHVLYSLCSVRLYLQLFVGGFMSYLRYVRFVFTTSCMQEGSCLIYVMFCSSLPPVVCRRAHVLFTLCSVRLYLQLYVGGLMSYLRYVLFVFTTSCLQKGSCLIYVMFCSSLPPVVCMRARVLFTLCSVRLYLQLFVRGLMSYIRYVLFVFTSSCLQESSCLIYDMFCSSLPPVVCKRTHVLYTLCSVRLYLQLFVGGLMSYIRYVLFVFTSSCLQEGSCLIYVMFCSSLPPVACRRSLTPVVYRRGHVLFTLCSVRLYLQLFVEGSVHVLLLCSVRLYLQLFVRGLMSYIRYGLFVFTSSCLQGLMSYIRYVLFVFTFSCLFMLRYVLFVFTTSCLQKGSCLIYVMFCSSLPPVVCKRAHVLYTLCSVRLYLQLFVGELQSYIRYVRFVFTSSCL